MSIQAIDGSSWEPSAARVVVRRTLFALAVLVVVAGPIAVGGAVAWVLTREAGPALSDDGWLRTKPAFAKSTTGFPLISAAEVRAAGSSLDEARRILSR